MKKSLLALTLPLIATVLFSCTKKNNVDEKVLNLSTIAKIKGMDPIYANDKYSSEAVSLIYEGLLQYHYYKRPYELTPNLAESMPEISKDGLVYTFKIKKGVLFQDDKAFPNGKGRELVAQDFVYSIKRLADPKLQGLGWWVIDGKIKGLNEWRKKYSGEQIKTVNYEEEVEGLKALDSHTIQFTLSKPFPQFLYALAMQFTFAVAKEVVDHYGKDFLNHPVGTGAFALPVFKQTNKITFTKNPTFRKKTFPCDSSEEFKAVVKENCGKVLPLVDKINLNVMIESQPRWLTFQKGRIERMEIPKDNFESAVTPSNGLSDELKKKGISLTIKPALDVTYTAFNHENPLFKDNVNLRRAMSLAFDVNGSNKLFHSNTALPAQSVVPPGIAGYMKDYKNPYRGYGTKENIEEAKKLLAKAGYPEGKGLPEITYDTTSSTTSRQSGEYLKKQMAQIGVKIRVILNTWPELQKKITQKQSMIFGIAWGADYPDAENFLQLLYGPNSSPGANGSNYNNPEFNTLFAKASIMQHSPERTALYEKMVRIAAEEVPWIMGLHRQSFSLEHGWLKNFAPTDFTSGVEIYWDVDLKKKAELLKNF